jgi:hypothetical protein
VQPPEQQLSLIHDNPVQPRGKKTLSPPFQPLVWGDIMGVAMHKLTGACAKYADKYYGLPEVYSATSVSGRPGNPGLTLHAARHANENDQGERSGEE